VAEYVESIDAIPMVVRVLLKERKTNF
jgi:hypothetical protein